ncbi:YisL family protein [Oceanobacillus sp. CFH 90083]|uniref:YisL family protein n=1 Tax=Oceanobacillus sp. CFH 90083 TaxID=2592336 RepID=UPI00128BEC90|nr:YisL family protein [Oceanobacillus sp. CFH 90083]
MTHMHITAWALGLILFIVALALYKKNSNKPATIVHMILRLVYLLIIISGGLLTWDYIQGYSMPTLGEAIVKAIAGFWIVVMMEMILVGSKKGKAVTGKWVQFFIALIIVIILGFFRLPMGFYF